MSAAEVSCPISPRTVTVSVTSKDDDHAYCNENSSTTMMTTRRVMRILVMVIVKFWLPPAISRLRGAIFSADTSSEFHTCVQSARCCAFAANLLRYLHFYPVQDMGRMLRARQARHAGIGS